MRLSAVLAVLIALTCCGCSRVAHGQVLATTSSPVVTGFTEKSSVDQVAPHVWEIFAEAIIPSADQLRFPEAGFGSYGLPFKLPPNQTVTRFQGSVSWFTPCRSDALAHLFAGGPATYWLSEQQNNAADNHFFDYSIPIETKTGNNARLFLDVGPQCAAGPAASWKMHALIEVQ
jgi:hypothetical protein